MAFGALKHRDVAEIHRMFKRFVSLVTGFAFSVGERAKIDGMGEPRDLYRSCGILRVIDYCVTDIAIVANNFAAITNVLSIMAAKTTRRVEVTDVVRVRCPVGSHLREEVSFKDSLRLGDCPFDRVIFLHVNLAVICLIETIENRGD
jgi:hypothetical protein